LAPIKSADTPSGKGPGNQRYVSETARYEAYLGAEVPGSPGPQGGNLPGVVPAASQVSAGDVAVWRPTAGWLTQYFPRHQSARMPSLH
jgi:hypothetical protein